MITLSEIVAEAVVALAAGDRFKKVYSPADGGPEIVVQVIGSRVVLYNNHENR